MFNRSYTQILRAKVASHASIYGDPPLPWLAACQRPACFPNTSTNNIYNI